MGCQLFQWEKPTDDYDGQPCPRTANTPAGRTWANFRDATWEKYGYDLNIADYIASRNTGVPSTKNGGFWDPRWDPTLATDTIDNTINPPTGATYGNSHAVVSTTGKFKGYSMGPGYYGKTFFIWPPDPRWGNGTPANKVADPTSPATTGNLSV